MMFLTHPPPVNTTNTLNNTVYPAYKDHIILGFTYRSIWRSPYSVIKIKKADPKVIHISGIYCIRVNLIINVINSVILRSKFFIGMAFISVF